MTSGHDLFISHSSGDAEVARELRSVLEQAGYSCWMAPDDVIGTNPWAQQILAGIQGSRAMLVLVSSKSNSSNHVAREVGLASGRDLPVLPIRIAEVAPQGALEYHLSGLQRIDAFPPPIAGHRERILRRLTTILPRQAAHGEPSSKPIEPQPRSSGPTAAPVTVPTAPRQTAAAAGLGTGDRTDHPAVEAIKGRAGLGLGAWARANSMLAGSAVTLAALFLVATIALALGGLSPAASTSPTATLAAVVPATPPVSPAATVPPSPTPTGPPIASGGAFPNAQEVDLFLALPSFGKSVIEDCERDTSGDATSIAAITCHADNGDLMFYERYADVLAQQRRYRDWVRVIMSNPTGSCASDPAGDAPWPAGDAPRGRLACYVQEDGGTHYYWTDEVRLVTAHWYGPAEISPVTGYSAGYQLFLDWTRE